MNRLDRAGVEALLSVAQQFGFGMIALRTEETLAEAPIVEIVFRQTRIAKDVDPLNDQQVQEAVKQFAQQEAKEQIAQQPIFAPKSEADKFRTLDD